MTQATADVLVREMGFSVDEFTAALPAAMRDWDVSGGPREWHVATAAGQVVAAIRVETRPDRRIGALSLPVLSVTVDLAAAPAGLADEFLRRIERGMHRGGG